MKLLPEHVVLGLGVLFCRVASSVAQCDTSVSNRQYNTNTYNVIGSRSCNCNNADPDCSCLLNCGCIPRNVDQTLTNSSTPSLDFIARGQPFQVLVQTKTQTSDQTDNICHTYYQIPGSPNYMLYISTVFIDGSNDIKTYVVSQEPVVARATNGDTVFEETIIVNDTGCDTSGIYRRYLFGDNATPENNAIVYVVGPLCSPRSSCCGQTAVQTLINAGYNQRYRILPENLPYKCVMSQPKYPTANTCSTSRCQR